MRTLALVLLAIAVTAYMLKRSEPAPAPIPPTLGKPDGVVPLPPDLMPMGSLPFERPALPSGTMLAPLRPGARYFIPGPQLTPTAESLFGERRPRVGF